MTAICGLTAAPARYRSARSGRPDGHAKRCLTSVPRSSPRSPRLQAENAAVKKELIARNLSLPGTVKPEAPAVSSDEPRLQLPNDADLNKVMNFVEKVWRRLLEMMATVHKDLLKKQS